MDELKWELLTEVQGRMQADLIKAYFEANGLETELFQEGAGVDLFPTTLDILGRVQIFIPKEQAEAAHQLWMNIKNSKARSRIKTRSRNEF